MVSRKQVKEPASDSGLRTVELFAGIGGFRIAADQLGIQTVFANDFDRSALSVYRAAFGGRELVEGDIHDHVSEVPAHDILTGGFPCQPFSFAGKKFGLADGRSSTLGAILKILKRNQPGVFVLENVPSLLTIASGRHFKALLPTLTDLGYVVEWRVRNVADLGLAQNRRRVIIMGYRGRSGSDEFDRSPYLFGDAGDLQQVVAASPISAWNGSFPNAGLTIGQLFSGWQEQRSNSSKVKLKDVLETRVAASYDFTASTLERVEVSTPINQFIDGVEVLYNQEGGRRMGYTIYGDRGLAPTLTSTSSRHYERYKVRGKFRRLTPIEYARLQGFPDHHCSTAAVAKQYVLYGNAIPPPLAFWALSCAQVASYEVVGDYQA